MVDFGTLFQELGSQPLPTTSEDAEGGLPRPRSGTWGSKSDSKHKDKDGKHKQAAVPSKEKHKSKHDSKAEAKKKKDKDKHGTRSGSTSRSNSAERRKSDDVQSPKKAGLLDGFRSRSNSDASKKKGSAFMASMKSAMLVSSWFWWSFGGSQEIPKIIYLIKCWGWLCSTFLYILLLN